MTDIQQWRRMIQPVRARTPAVELDDTDAMRLSSSPRKRLKPKISSYFGQHAHDTGPSQRDVGASSVDGEPAVPAWPTGDPYPNPEADVLIDSVMCRLLGSPYEGLHPRFNSLLLQIFESFRHLSDEKQQLLLKSQQDSDRVDAMEKAMQKSTHQWNGERQEYKAEVKRLELLLAKGKRGVAEVTLARQDSKLRSRQSPSNKGVSKRDTLGTITDFLEKSKRDDERYWSSQRATMRRRSPSAEMRHLSKKFMSNESTHTDIPVGTPALGPSTLAEASFLEHQQSARKSSGAGHAELAASNPKTSFSTDDTVSTFSCAGDFLPDESNDVNLIEVAGTDNDFVAIKRIAHVLARRRHVDIEKVMPKLLQIFAAQSYANGGDSPKAEWPRAQTAMADVSTAPPTRKNTKLMAKASGFFNKLRPQLSMDTAQEGRFSFEAGDDSAVSAPALARNFTVHDGRSGLPAVNRERVLRKCASTPLLSDPSMAEYNSFLTRPVLSPVEHSPTSSAAPSESRRTSRIPTPVYGSGRLARPRQERESSESSLLTAIKHSEEVDRRSNSISSSGASSHRPIRGNAFAEAAAVKAGKGADMVHHGPDGVRPGPSSASGWRSENVRPMKPARRNVDHEGDT